MQAAKKLSSVLSTIALGLGLAFANAATVTAQDGGRTPCGGTRPMPGTHEVVHPTLDECKALVMIDYASFGETEALLRIIREFHLNVNLADSNGFTPLMAAAQNGNTDTALALIALGADRTLRDKVRHMTAAQMADAAGYSQTAAMIRNHDHIMLPKPGGPRPN